MTTYSLTDDYSYFSRIFYFKMPKSSIYIYFVGLSTIYIFVYINTPLAVFASAGYDDGLYMKLGQSLVEGHWLGPYSEFTLMKGPGYPVFLAAANWFRIPVGWAHALFHCTAAAFFVVVCHRFVKSIPLSGLLFGLLVWSPIFLTVILLRVVRDAVYPDQVMAFLAAFIFALFCASSTRQRVGFAILSGLLLGWIWLTREEGVWLIPGIALLVAAAGLYAFYDSTLRRVTGILLIVAVTFGAVQVAFGLANLRAYGMFVGVDFKEKNYQRTLRALHSVVSGGTRPFVSVTNATRHEIFAASPTFASLAKYLDVPGDQGWGSTTCRYVASICGEVGTAWFVWQLRNAAASAGHYSSPAEASAFFGRIADEITEACGRGTLECRPQLVSEMPQYGWDQLKDIPRLFVQAFQWVLFINPPLQTNPSMGDDTQLAWALKFLNYPRFSSLTNREADTVLYTINGWYLKSGHEWIWAAVKDAAGTSMPLRFDRRASPDLTGGDPGATAQRFTLATRCNDDCTLTLEMPDGTTTQKKFSELRDRTLFAIRFGGGTFMIESVGAQQMNTPETTTRPEQVAGRLRVFALTRYNTIFLPLLLVSIVAFLVSTTWYWRTAPWNVCYVLALTAWGLVFVRVSLLVLITATSMDSLHGVYNGPICLLLVSAVIFSLASLMQLSGRLPPNEPQLTST